MDSEQKTTLTWIIGAVAVLGIALPFILKGNQSLSGDLARAVQKSDVYKVTQLLETGVDPNTRILPSDDGANSKARLTLLMYTALHDQTNIAQVLLDHHANLELRDFTNGDTALGWAARRGSLNMELLLLNHGARLDVVDPAGDTPVTLAARAGKLDCVRLLIIHGARVDVQTGQEASPLEAAKESGNAELIAYLRSLHSR